MNLEQFLSPNHKSPRNMWVSFPGFAELYVRKGPYYIQEHKKRPETIQLANFTAEKEGHGTFRRLINFLEKNYPELVIVVECVQTERLKSICHHMGFEQINIDSGLHFVKF